MSQVGFLETDWGRQGVAPSDQGGCASPPLFHPASSGSPSEASRFASVAGLCQGLFAGGSGDPLVSQSGQEDQILGSNLSQSQKGFSQTEADHRFVLAKSVCASKTSQGSVMGAYHGGPEGQRTILGIADRLEELVPSLGSPPEHQEMDAISPGKSGIPSGEYAVWLEHVRLCLHTPIEQA